MFQRMRISAFKRAARFIAVACLAAPALAIFSTPSTVRADYADGQQQYQAGKYLTALEIWRKSAWQDDDFRAQTKLGEIYAKGELARRDPVEAYVWYFLALVNQSEFGRSASAREAKLDQLDMVVRQMDRLAFSMSTLEQEEARRRIVYILASRGAAGFFKLAELYHDDDNHRYCKNIYSKTASGDTPVNFDNFPHRPLPYDTSLDGRGLDLWVYCEYGTEIVPFNVFPKNNVEALAYYMLAEQFGHPVAAESVSDYEAYLRIKFSPGATRAPTGDINISRLTKMFHALVDNEIEPFAQRIDLVDDVIVSAKRHAAIWQAPFERYPGGYSDLSEGRFAHQLALERMGELAPSAVQEALRFKGFYKGFSDNNLGAYSQKAIAKYQASIGDKITGELTARQAVRLIQEAADDNHAFSQDVLGTMYYQGIGVPVNYVRALSWFEEAARQRFPYAYMHLAVLYRDGLGVAPDRDKAAAYLVQARDTFLSQGKSSGSPEVRQINREFAKLRGEDSPVADEIEIKDIQAALKTLGLYAGPIDNDDGPGTQRGIKAFQKSLSQRQTGLLTAEQTETLLTKARNPAQTTTQ